MPRKTGVLTRADLLAQRWVTLEIDAQARVTPDAALAEAAHVSVELVAYCERLSPGAGSPGWGPEGPPVNVVFALAHGLGCAADAFGFEGRTDERFARHRELYAEPADEHAAAAWHTATAVTFDGEPIRREREARGWSVEQLAERARLDDFYVEEAERGEPSEFLLVTLRLLHALHGSVRATLDALPVYLMPGPEIDVAQVRAWRTKQAAQREAGSDEARAPLDGRRFKVLRERRGLSVEAVAELADFTFASNLAEWEEQSHDPHREQDIGELCRLANVLHVDVLALTAHLLGDPTVTETSVLDSAPRAIPQTMRRATSSGAA